MIPVIMATYRGEKRLPRARATLISQGVDVELFIRDNNENGVYYTKAINEGLRKYAFKSKIEFCLVTSDDVYLRPNCLKALIECAKENPKAGIVSPVQVNEHEQVVWAGSAWSWPMGAHVNQVLRNTSYVTHWASGAIFLVRTKMIREIGLLDENMLFICSDADYSFAARARGWLTLVEPRAKVEHSFRGSKKTSDKALDMIKTKDLIYFSRKWITGGVFRDLEFKGHERVTHEAALREEREWTELVDQSKLFEGMNEGETASP